MFSTSKYGAEQAGHTRASNSVRRVWQTLMTFFALSVCALVPTKSWASCTWYAGQSMGILTFSYTGTVNINPTLPIGTTLATMQNTMSAYGGGNNLVYCNTAARADFIGVGAASGNIYPSSVNGVGIRISFPNSTFLPGGVYFPTYNNYPADTSYWANPNVVVKVELVKTGTITAGGSFFGEFGKWMLSTTGSPTIQEVSMQFSPSIPVVPTTPTCGVTSPNPIGVTLPDTPAIAFGGVGTTAGLAQSFNITLSCSGGSAGTSTGMYVTLTDATNPGNTTDMLSPTAATASTGVGVRIFNGGVPVRFGPDSSTVGNTNQWRVTTVGVGLGSVSIPLTATYVQVGSTVQGGQVQAIATFTMAYN